MEKSFFRPIAGSLLLSLLGLTLLTGFGFHRNLMVFLAVIGWTTWMTGVLLTTLFFWARFYRNRWNPPATLGIWIIMGLLGGIFLGLGAQKLRRTIGFHYARDCWYITPQKWMIRNCWVCESGIYVQTGVLHSTWLYTDSVIRWHRCWFCQHHPPEHLWLCVDRWNPWIQWILPPELTPEEVRQWNREPPFSASVEGFL